MAAERKWFAQSTNGHRYGPHDASFFASWAKRGAITPKSLVWTAGQTDWLSADQTELRSLFDGVELPPPLPHERDQADEAEPPKLPESEPAAAPSDVLGNDLLAGYSGSFQKQTNLEPSSGKEGWHLKPRQFLLLWLGTCALIFAGVFVVGFATGGKGFQFGGVNNAAVEACQWEFIGGGGNPDHFDWKRAYMTNAYADFEGPVPTKINGEPIKCVIIPKIGVERSSERCGVLSTNPKDHWVCRMVFDRGQDVWIPTWKARQSG